MSTSLRDDVATNVKRCGRCKKDAPLTSFANDRSRQDGLTNSCRGCIADRDKQHRLVNLEKERTWDRVGLLRKYGLTVEQYDTMLETQDSRCGICGTDEPGGPRNQWNIDHDHETKQVRGILCNNCNMGIGKLKDDIFILESAIVYLQCNGVEHER